jgi:5-methyltetrahydrofolate--homocysteine methyltransferase
MMSALLYKEDWDAGRDALAGWWRREVNGGPAVGVIAPRAKPLPALPPVVPADARDLWLNPAVNIYRAEQHMRDHVFLGACFPYLTAGLGPGCLNTFLGSEPVFADDTVWYKPVFKDPATARLEFRGDNPWWRWTLDTTRRYLDAARGKCAVAIPDLIEGIDVLSELLGTEELLTYLVDCPDEIHRLLRQLDDLYYQAFDPLYELTRDDRGGNAFIAFHAWGPGRTLKSQCDFSAMISPGMFAEFVAPYLERQCARCDFSTYHLDGVNAIRHLDVLCQVKSLKAIQWTPGYPNPPSADRMWWDRVWRKVYASGKSAMVLGNPPEMVEPFLREFGAAGTMITTGTATEHEARELMDNCKKWGI